LPLYIALEDSPHSSMLSSSTEAEVIDTMATDTDTIATKTIDTMATDADAIATKVIDTMVTDASRALVARLLSADADTSGSSKTREASPRPPKRKTKEASSTSQQSTSKRKIKQASSTSQQSASKRKINHPNVGGKRLPPQDDQATTSQSSRLYTRIYIY